MKNKVQMVLNGTDIKDSIKYLQHSTHDDSISNSVLFLEPVNHNFVDIPFASSIIFELHYDEQCVAQQKSRDCFQVIVYHNNTPLKFDTCLDANLKRGSRSDFCLVDDFMAHFDKIKFQGDIDKACAQNFVPPTD